MTYEAYCFHLCYHRPLEQMNYVISVIRKIIKQLIDILLIA